MNRLLLSVIGLMWGTVQALAETAPAPAAPAGTGGGAPPAFMQFLPMVVIFLIFYFLLIRPQQKKAKLQQDFLKELKRGDMVITNGGIVGTIKAVSDKLITLEIDNGVCMKVLRSQVLESANSLKDAKPA